MLDTTFLAFAAAGVGYFVLWLIGCRLPGTSRRSFRGWIFSCDDPTWRHDRRVEPLARE
ncbi:hypothetical protein OP10G_0755 [Fimbriimonas ginsengisoli Gsoil 348]|uniref:Uncharacterized protein n=1 Tax=Fimbriimonas ginsengisoli Gsoil 348 TaxID=661478 RepID=A0A068NKN4_FIMGI|nr:hypothetical protein OP10G_0755 [Fimbriimonas ginsengisoli Gsoil 348]